jgi:hypothetical protein
VNLLAALCPIDQADVTAASPPPSPASKLAKPRPAN